MELVNDTGEDLATQPLMPSIYKMIATVLLQSGFEAGFVLGRNSQGIVEPIQLPAKGARRGLGYVPTDDDEKTKRMKDQVLAKTIPHLYHSILVREYAEHEYLAEGICGLFEKIDAVIEEVVELASIRHAETRKMLQNWTSVPILIP